MTYKIGGNSFTTGHNSSPFEEIFGEKTIKPQKIIFGTSNLGLYGNYIPSTLMLGDEYFIEYEPAYMNIGITIYRGKKIK